MVKPSTRAPKRNMRISGSLTVSWNPSIINNVFIMVWFGDMVLPCFRLIGDVSGFLRESGWGGKYKKPRWRWFSG
jgi:hypothetical protein